MVGTSILEKDRISDSFGQNCIPLPEQLLAYSQTRIAVIRLEHLQQMKMVRQMKLK